jgi:hypothetical protein
VNVVIATLVLVAAIGTAVYYGNKWQRENGSVCNRLGLKELQAQQVLCYDPKTRVVYFPG